MFGISTLADWKKKNLGLRDNININTGNNSYQLLNDYLVAGIIFVLCTILLNPQENTLK